MLPSNTVYNDNNNSFKKPETPFHHNYSSYTFEEPL